MKQSILVLGATGNVGSNLVQTLLSLGHQVKAASRSGKPHLGATGVVFDYLDPTSFEQAFADVDAVYILLAAGYTDPQKILIPIIEFAAQKKVKVVLQTALGVDADDSIPYRQVELALQQTSIPYAIIRPNWFADNFHTFWKAGIDLGEIQLPAGTGKSSFIDIRDIADCAAILLTSNQFDGQAFNLTGPEALSYSDAADLLSKALDKPIRYQNTIDEIFIARLTEAGLTQAYAEFVASIFYPVREGWTALITNDVETLTGKKPLSLHDYIDANLTALA